MCSAGQGPVCALTTSAARAAGVSTKNQGARHESVFHWRLVMEFFLIKHWDRSAQSCNPMHFARAFALQHRCSYHWTEGLCTKVGPPIVRRCIELLATCEAVGKHPPLTLK